FQLVENIKAKCGILDEDTHNFDEVVKKKQKQLYLVSKTVLHYPQLWRCTVVVILVRAWQKVAACP
ncbi:hypothetical protein EJ02DRAFT_346566, partial [Clathrospora elynae]